MMLLSKEALAGLLASAALLVCAPQLLSSSPPEWATKPDASKVERGANDWVGTPSSVQNPLPSASGLDRFRGLAGSSSGATRVLNLDSNGDVLAAMDILRFVAGRPDLESCAAARSEGVAPTDRVVPRIDWTTRETESALDEFCATASLRGSIVREATESRAEVRVANLNGVLVREGQELESGITVHKIGVDFVDLREGTRARRITVAAKALPSSEEGSPK